MTERSFSLPNVDMSYRERALSRSADQEIVSADTQPGSLPAIAVHESVVLVTDEKRVEQFDFRPDDN
jgi:hypothetical protein